MSKIIKWQGYEWLTQERWGQIHSGKPECWYDPSAVEILYHPNNDDELLLKTHYNPKEFNIFDNKIISPIGVGLVSCKEKFSYGYFEIKAQLPEGPLLWPAFWMWSWDSWPPEIDVFEGYTNKNGSYFNWSHEMLLGKFWRTPSNIHLGKYPDNYNMGAKNHWLGFKSPAKKINKYAIEWLPYRITILFNDEVVRNIIEPSIIKQFNNTKMNVIINNSIQKEYLDHSDESTESSMRVSSFIYELY